MMTSLAAQAAFDFSSFAAVPAGALAALMRSNSAAMAASLPRTAWSSFSCASCARFAFSTLQRALPFDGAGSATAWLVQCCTRPEYDIPCITSKLVIRLCNAEKS